MNLSWMNFKNNFNLKTTVKGQKSDAIDCFIKIWNSEQSFYIGGRVQASEDRVHVSKTKKYGTIKGWTGVILGERGKTVCLSVYDTEIWILSIFLTSLIHFDECSDIRF